MTNAAALERAKIVRFLKRSAMEVRAQHLRDPDPFDGQAVLMDGMARSLELAAESIEAGEHNG